MYNKYMSKKSIKKIVCKFRRKFAESCAAIYKYCTTIYENPCETGSFLNSKINQIFTVVCGQHTPLALIPVIIFGVTRKRGQRLIGISRSLIWSKTLMELISNPCGEVRRAQSAKSTLLTSLVGAPGFFSDLLRFHKKSLLFISIGFYKIFRRRDLYHNSN